MRTFLTLTIGGCVGSTPGTTTSETGDSATPAAPPTAFVLVVDNSDSMLEEAESLALSVAGAVFPAGSLVSVTTTDGTGVLVGDVISADHGPAVQQQILCGATCISDTAALPSDPAHVCGDPVTLLSEEAMDCLCAGDWRANCGSANEQGLEAGYQASLDPTAVPAGHQARIVVISDEGDGSERLQDGDGTVGDYEDLLGDAVFDAIVPELDANGQVICPGTGSDWGVQRYAAMSALTGGLLLSIYDASCTDGDVGAAFGQILAAVP